MSLHTARDLDLAETRLAARAYREVHALCLKVLEAEPNAARAWFLMGVISADHDNPAKASELFSRAVALEPATARHHAYLARALIALNRQAEARAAANLGAGLDPGDALTLDTLGVVYTRLGDHGRALPFFERAAGLDPGNPSLLFNLAASRQFAGDFPGAEDAYGRCLALDPANHRAWSSRVQLRRQTPGDNHAATLEAQFARCAGDPDPALHLGHALAKTWEDLGDHPAAMAWLGRAKAPKRAAVSYKGDFDKAVFAAARRTFPPVKPTSGHPSEAPIFVVGLPRSGTTLIDRILSSHSAVTSAGELGTFSLLVKRATGTPSRLVLDPETLDAAEGLDFARLGEAYVDAARALVGEAERFVDKMPLNVLYAGLIHRALPQARIVCLRREPMDVCLANYRQLFATGFSYYNYAFDPEDIARYYIGFDALVGHWRRTLPEDRFLELAYEDMIADQRGQTERLLAFCGLAWEEACLSFHDQTAPVATASSVQVRQPLYATSIGRWRLYGDALAPMRAILRQAGRVDEEGQGT